MVLKKDQIPSVELMPGVTQMRSWDQTTGAGSVSMGTIILQPGTELKPHYHLVEDAMVVISGNGTFIVENAETPISAGDALLAPANSRHFIRNDGTKPLIIVYTWPSVHVARLF